MRKISSRKPHLVTPVMEERIILVAYREGSILDRMIVHFTRRHNPKVETLYQSHLEAWHQTSERFSEVVCPERLEMRLFDVCEEVPRRFTLADLLHQLAYNMRATGAIAAAAVLGFVLWSNFDSNRKQHEIELATLQAKESIALIGSIMNGTQKTVHDKVILEQTSLPLRESIFKGTETIKKNL